MARQSWNPGYLFWLHTLIGVPFGAFAIVWVSGILVDSAAVLLASFALLLAAAAVVAWRLPRIRDKEPVARLGWAVAGAGIGAGATMAWAAAAFIVMLHIVCGGGGCDFGGAD